MTSVLQPDLVTVQELEKNADETHDDPLDGDEEDSVAGRGPKDVGIYGEHADEEHSNVPCE